MAKEQMGKVIIFGIISGIVLALMGWIVNLLTGTRQVSVQLALLPSTIQAQIPSGSAIGQTIVGVITQKLGFGIPNAINVLIVGAIGGALVSLIGWFVYITLQKRFFGNFKSNTNRIAAIFAWGGLVIGLILSSISGQIQLPAFSTAITLALSSLVVAYIVVWVLNISNQQRYIPEI